MIEVGRRLFRSLIFSTNNALTFGRADGDPDKLVSDGYGDGFVIAKVMVMVMVMVMGSDG